MTSFCKMQATPKGFECKHCGVVWVDHPHIPTCHENDSTVHLAIGGNGIVTIRDGSMMVKKDE